jgi:ribosomal protein S13
MNGEHNHNRLVTAYLPHDQLPVHWRHAPEACRRYHRFILEELRSSSSAIISGEALSAFFTTAAAERMREDLERLGFRRFHVILYVRDPADYFLSFLQQTLKSSDEKAPMGWHPATFRYDIRRIVETWEQVFPGNLIVRTFAGNAEANVVEDFSSLLQEHLGMSLKPSRARMNATISAEGMKILQDYRLAFWPDNQGVLTPDTARLVSFLEQSTAAVHQTKPVLKSKVAEHIRANHEADMNFIYSRYGVELRQPNAIPQKQNLRPAYRVVDLVESLDSEVVHEVLLRLAKSELERTPAKRSLARRIASRAYRAIRS